jgi:hypothetical protein
VRVDLYVRGRLHPLPQSLIRGNAGRLSEGLHKPGEHIRRQREGLASRDIQRQQGLQSARCVAREPVANGIAVDAQELGYGLTALSLATGQEIEHLQPWLLAASALALEVLLEKRSIFDDER